MSHAILLTNKKTDVLTDKWKTLMKKYWKPRRDEGGDQDEDLRGERRRYES